MHVRNFILIGVGFLLAISGPAHAATLDEANALHQRAMTSGSPRDRAEAARILATSVLANPDRPDAVLRAFEAGQTLCIYAGCQGAKEMAAFASSRPLPTNVLTSEDINLLSAFADWITADAPGTRERLDAALTSYLTVRATPLAIIAFQTRYTEDFNAKDWGRAAKSAREASIYLAPHRAGIGERWSDAVIASATAGYNHNPDLNDTLILAHHVSDLIKLDRELPQRPNWLERDLYLSTAWRAGILMYFQSNRSSRAVGASRYEVSGPDPDLFKQQAAEIIAQAGPNDMLPTFPSLCDGSFDEDPEFRYPFNALKSRQNGAVVLRMDLNNGKASNVEVLASIPERTFDNAIISSIRKWTYEPNENAADDGPCEASAKGLIYTYSFGVN